MMENAECVAFLKLCEKLSSFLKTDGRTSSGEQKNTLKLPDDV